MLVKVSFDLGSTFETTTDTRDALPDDADRYEAEAELIRFGRAWIDNSRAGLAAPAGAPVLLMRA